jgi:hypothetical protein
MQVIVALAASGNFYQPDGARSNQSNVREMTCQPKAGSIDTLDVQIGADNLAVFG